MNLRRFLRASLTPAGLACLVAISSLAQPVSAETCHRDSNGDFICCDNSGVCYRRDQ